MHGTFSQGFIYGSGNNYLSMETNKGSAKWSEGSINLRTALADNLHVGAQLHSYFLGELGRGNAQLDWAFADYRVKQWLGFRGGKLKAPLGLFGEIEDTDTLYNWALLPQPMYEAEFRSFNVPVEGGEIYVTVRHDRNRFTLQMFGGGRNIAGNDSITAAELRSVFLQDGRSLSDGSLVEPVLSKGDAAHEAFLRQYVGKSDEGLRIYYRTLVFTGTGTMPKVLDSDPEIVRYVARTKGAIGYVSNDSPTPGVKVLAIAQPGANVERQLVTRVEPEYPETLQRLLIGRNCAPGGCGFPERKRRERAVAGWEPGPRRARDQSREAMGLYCELIADVARSIRSLRPEINSDAIRKFVPVDFHEYWPIERMMVSALQI